MALVQNWEVVGFVSKILLVKQGIIIALTIDTALNMDCPHKDLHNLPVKPAKCLGLFGEGLV